jgi:fibronectin-binding autotransporter adhesin
MRTTGALQLVVWCLMGLFLSLAGGSVLNAATTTLSTTQTLLSLDFTGGNSFTVNGGVITVNGHIRGGDGGTLSISNATVTQGSNSAYLFGAAYNGNTTTGFLSVGNGGVLNIGNGGARTFIGGGDSGSATGIAVLTLSGSGVVNIGAAGGFPNDRVYFSGYGGSGTVYLNGGMLSTSRTMTGGGNSNAFLYFNGGTLQVGPAFSANSALIDNSFGIVRIQSGGAYINTNGINASIGKGLLEDSSATGGGVTKSGAGSLTLSMASTYTGGTTVLGGILYLGGSSLGTELGTVANSGRLTLSGGVVNFGSYTTYTVGGLAGVTGLSLANNSGAALTLTVGNGNGYSSTYSGILSGAGSLTKQGAGTQVLSGANTFTGPTIVSAGTLQIGAGGTGGALSSGGSLSIGSGAVLAFNQTDTVVQGTDFGPVISGSGSVFQLGSGTLVLSGANTYTGPTVVSAGTLQLGAGGTGGALSAGGSLSIGSGAVLAFNQTDTVVQGTDFGPVISGLGGVTQLGSGQVILLGANTYTGGNTVSAGELILQNTFSGPQAIASGALLTLASGASMSGLTTFTGSGTLKVSRDLTFGISGISNMELSAGGLLWLTGNASVTGSFSHRGYWDRNQGSLTVDAGSSIDFVEAGATGIVNVDALNGGGTVRGSYYVTGSPTVLYLGVANGTGAFSGSIMNGAQNTGSGSFLSVVKSGSGTQVLSGANTYTGPTIVSAGTLQIGAGGTGGALSAGGSLSIGSGAVLAFNQTDTVVQGTDFGPVISGSGSVFQLGSGTLMLSGTNTYTGPTVVSAGTLQLGAGGTGGALSAGGSLSIGSGAVLAFNQTDTVVQGTDFGPVISGSGGVTQFGSGKVILLGANTYTGLTTVSAGVLNIQNAGALGATAGPTFVASGAALQLEGGITVGAEALTLTGTGAASDGALRNVSGTNVYGGNITLGSASRINSDAGVLTLSGSISGTYSLSVGGGGSLAITGVLETSTGSLTKDGTGTLTLSGANTFTGALNINNGVVQMQGAAFSTVARTYNIGSGAVLNLVGNTGVPVGTSTVAGDGTFRISAGYFSNETPTPTASYGPGRNVNMTLNAGAIIDVESGAYFRNGGWQNINWSNNYAVLNVDGTFDVWDGNTVYAAALTGGGTVLNNMGVTRDIQVGRNSGSGTFSGVIRSAGLFEKIGGGTQVLSGANTYTGATKVTAGTLQLGAGGTTGSLSASGALSIASGAVLAFNQTDTVVQGADFGPVISGAGSVLQMGSGTLVLSGTNTYGGGTTLGAGRLNLNSSAALGTGSLTIAAATTLGNSSGSAVTLNNNAQFWNGSFTFAGGSDLNLGTGAVTLGASPVLSVSAGTLTVGGAISGNYGLTKDGSGWLRLSGANTYNGATTVSAGTLQVGVGGIAGSLSAVGALSIGSGAVLAFNQTDTVVQGTGFGPVISGAGSVMQLGSGTLVLSGTNTYSGGTTLGAGRLNLNSSAALGTGSLTIAAATILGNSSGAAVTLNNNAQVWNGSFTFAGGDDLNFGMGAVTLGASPVVTISAGTLTVGGVISGNYGLTKAGTGWMELSGANVYNGATTVNAGTLQLGAGGTAGSLSALGSVTIGSGAVLAFNQTDTVVQGTDFGPVISGAGSVLQLGTGTLVLSRGNTYSGGTSLDAGRLDLNSSDAMGKGSLTIAAATTLGNSSGASVTLKNDNVQVWNGSFTFAGGSDLNLGRGAVTLGASPVVTISAGTLTVGGAISGNYGLTKAGSGVLRLSGANVYSGPTTVSAGTLQLGAGGTSGSLGAGGSLSIGSGAVLAFNQTDTVMQGTDFGSVISGAGSVLQLGRGTLVLSGVNTHSGGTTLGAGRLNLNSSTALGTGVLTIANATTLGNNSGSAVTLNNNAQVWNGSFTFAGSNDLNLGNGTVGLGVSLTVTVTEGTLAVGGPITGAYALRKAGNGVLTLRGANSYSGGTTLSEGTLNLNNAAVLDATSVFTIAGGAIDNTSGAALALATNPTQTWSGDFTFKGTNDLSLGTGAVSLSGNRILTVGAGTLTVGGGIGGVYSLSKQGEGALTLSGANTFSGGLELSSGLLNIQSPTALGGAASVFTINGGTLDNTSGVAIALSNNNEQVWNANVTFRGTNDLNLGSGTVTLSGNRTVTVSAGTLTVGGGVQGGYSLTKEGAGRLTLTGTSSYTGATLVNAGTLQIGNGGSTGALSSLSALTNNSTLAFNLSGTLTQGTGFGSTIAGTGTLLQVGPGTLVLAGSNTYTGATLISGGTLQIGAGGDRGSLFAGGVLTNNATLAFNRSDSVVQAVDFAGAIGGTGALRQVGSGTLVLNGSNTYTGTTWIESGVLQLGSGGVSGALSAGGAITNNATLAFNRSDTITQGVDFGGAIVGTGQLQQIGSGTLTLNGVNAHSGGTTLAAGRLNVNSPGALGSGLFTISAGMLDNTSGGTVTLGSNNAQTWAGDFAFVGSSNLNLGTGNITLGSQRIVTVNAGTLGVAGTIAGPYALTKAGQGTLELGGSNTFSGMTSVNAGTLLLTNNNALQTSAYNSNSTGVLAFGPAATDPLLGGLTGSGAFALGAGVNSLTLNLPSGVSQTYSGSISGTLALVKAGAGMQILTGTSTYSGHTTVSGGFLKLAGAASIANSSGLTIAPGARFAFEPSAVSLAAGTLNVASLSVGAGSSLGLKWGKSIAVGTTPSVAGVLRINMTGAYSSGISYTVLSAPGGLNAGSFALSGVSDYVYTLTRTATSVVVTPTSISGLSAAYWRGGVVADDPLTWTSSNFTVDSNFNFTSGTSNWKADPLGTVDTNLIPGTSTEVYLTNLASAGSLLMRADADMALKGLTVTASNPVTLSDVGGSFLFLGSSGISLSGTAGSVTLEPAITLTANQTWTNESPNELLIRGTLDSGTASFGLNIGGLGNTTLQGVVSGISALTMSGTGMLTLTAANTFTGPTTVASGTLRIGSGGVGGSIRDTSSITNNGALEFNQTDNYGGSMNMVIAGSGSVSVWDGSLTLAAANSYTGGTSIRGGRLNLAGGSNRLSTSGSLNLLAGVLDLGGNSQATSGTVFLLGGTFENGTLTALVNDFIAESGVVSGVLAGPVGLNKTGAGILTLKEESTYTGGTTVQSGTLRFSGGNNLLSTTGSLAIRGGVLDLGGRSQTTTAPILFAGGTVQNGVLEASGSAFDAQDGSVSAVLAGNMALLKTTPGQLTLSGVNTYAGGTELRAGSLLLRGGLNRLPTSGSLRVTGGVMDLGGYSHSTSGPVSFLGGVVQNGILTATGTAFVAEVGTVSAELSGIQGLVKRGSGAFTLTALNSYSGGTTVNEGSLLLTGGSNRLSVGGAITVAGGVLDLGGNSQVTLGTVTFTGGVVQNGTLAANGTAFLGEAGTVNAVLEGTMGLRKIGTGVLTLSNVNTYSGGTTVEEGSLLLVGGDDRLFAGGDLNLQGGVLDLGGNIQRSAGVITLNGGTVQGGSLVATGSGFDGRSGRVTAVLGGAQGLVKSGAGTLTLSGANIYTGATTVLDGTLLLSGGSNRLSSAGDITTSGGVLDLGGNAQSFQGAIRLDGGTVRNGTLTATGSAFDGRAGSVTAVLEGTLGLVKSGPGTLTLGAANTYTGATNILDGTLVLSGGSNRLSSAGDITTSGGVLDLGGNAQSTQGTIRLDGGTVLNGTLTATGSAFNGLAGSVSAVLAGTQGLVKSGPGTLSLSGLNEYVGGTTVLDGTLLLLGGSDRLSAAGAIMTGGGVLDLGGNSQSTSGVITFAGGAVENGTLISNVSAFAAQSGTINASLAGSQGLLKSGSGALTLGGVNRYAGATTLDEGSLLLSGGDDRLPTAAALSINAGVLDLGGSRQNTSGTITIRGGVVQNGTLEATGTPFLAEAGIINAVLAGGQGLLKSGTGTLTLGVANSYTGGTTLLDGTLLFAGGNDLLSTSGAISLVGGALDLGGGTQTTSGLVTVARGVIRNGFLYGTGAGLALESGTVSAVISGSYGVTKTTGGTVILSAQNTYSGGTTVAAGTLLLEGGDDRLFANGDLRVQGGVLDLGGNRQNSAGLIRLDGGMVQNGSLNAIGSAFDGRAGTVTAVLGGTQGLVKSGTGTLTLSGANNYTGGTTVLDGTLLLAGGNDRLLTTGDLQIQGGALDLGGNSQNTSGVIRLDGGVVRGGTLIATGADFDGRAGSVSGVLAGLQALVKNGPGTLSLSGVNEYSGGTTVLDGTLLLAGGADRLLGTGDLRILGGVLDLGGNSQTTSGLIRLDGGTVQNGNLFATGLAFDARSGSVSAVLGGTQGLVKSDPRTLSLTVSSTYTGGTTVLDGTLLLAGGNDRLALAGDITTSGGVLDLGGNSQQTRGRSVWTVGPSEVGV